MLSYKKAAYIKITFIIIIIALLIVIREMYYKLGVKIFGHEDWRSVGHEWLKTKKLRIGNTENYTGFSTVFHGEKSAVSLSVSLLYSLFLFFFFLTFSAWGVHIWLDGIFPIIYKEFASCLVNSRSPAPLPFDIHPLFMDSRIKIPSRKRRREPRMIPRCDQGRCYDVKKSVGGSVLTFILFFKRCNGVVYGEYL